MLDVLRSGKGGNPEPALSYDDTIKDAGELIDPNKVIQVLTREKPSLPLEEAQSIVSKVMTKGASLMCGLTTSPVRIFLYSMGESFPACGGSSGFSGLKKSFNMQIV